MSNIEQNLAKILNSRYGRDVRQAIHDGIHNCYEDGQAGSIDLVARELIQQKMSGSPAGTYADLDALNAGTPTAPDVAKIYITLDDGNWCYHNGSAWVAGGVYQNVSDASITQAKLTFDTSDVMVYCDSISIVKNKANNAITCTLYGNVGNAGKTVFYRYGKDGNRLHIKMTSSSPTVYTLTNWQVLVWDLSDDSFKIQNDNVIRSEQSILLLRNANGNVSGGVLADFHAAHKDQYTAAITSQSVEIKPGLLNSVTVTLTDASSYANSIYVYGKDGGHLLAHKINESPKAYTVDLWESLVLDLTDNTIKILGDRAQRPSSTVLLFYNGVSYSGALADLYSLLKAKNVRFTKPSDSINFETPESVYCYQQYNRAVGSRNIYFKWTDDIYIYHGDLVVTKDFSVVLSDLDAYYKRDSVERVTDCCFVPDGYFVAYDHSSGAFIVNTLANINNFNYTIIAENRGGLLAGELAPFIVNQLAVDNRLRSSHIVSSYIGMVEAKEDEIIPLLTDDTFSFAFSSDHHDLEWQNGHTNQTYNVLERVSKTLNLDAIVNTGDSVPYGYSATGKTVGYGALKSMANKLSRKDALYFTIGNHDYGSASGVYNSDPEKKQRRAWITTPIETYNLIGKHHEEDCVWGNRDMMYYYRDFTDKKIRMIFLNSSDNSWTWANDGADYLTIDPMEVNGFRQTQAEWLAGTALDLSGVSSPSDWAVIVFCHTPLFTTAEGMTWNAPDLENGPAIRTILEAFMAGTSTTATYSDTTYGGEFTLNVPVNFVAQGAMDLVGVFSGHIHLDRLVTSANGLNNVTITSGYADQTLITKDPLMVRNVREYTEVAFDVVLVDKSAKTVTMKRFGAGSDRNFAY